MKIALLSFQSYSPVKSSYEEDRLMQEALKLQEEGQDLSLEVIDVMPFQNGERSLEELMGFDVFLPRARVLYSLEEVLRIFKDLEEKGKEVLNGYKATLQAKNKIETARILKEKGVSVPHAFVANSLDDYEKSAQEIGFPQIIKVPQGTYGRGVMLVESMQSGRSVVDCLLQKTFHGIGGGTCNHCKGALSCEQKKCSSGRLQDSLIIQEFIKESKGEDLRIFVVGNEVVAAMKRSAQGDEFRSNAELGAVVSEVELSEEEVQISLDSTKALGLDFAGVDVIRSSRGPLVLEVNANPGFKALEAVSGVNVARCLLDLALSLD
jgi:ribosomal protein S6--L-glutamate ligase